MLLVVHIIMVLTMQLDQSDTSLSKTGMLYRCHVSTMPLPGVKSVTTKNGVWTANMNFNFAAKQLL